MGQPVRENRLLRSPIPGVPDDFRCARRGVEEKDQRPRPSCPPVADKRQMTGRRATPTNTDGVAFRRSHLVTLHHSDPCFLVKEKKRLLPILTCRICSNFLSRSPAVRTPSRGHPPSRRIEALTSGPAIGEGPLQFPASSAVSPRKYRPGVTPRAFRKTDTKALRLL